MGTMRHPELTAEEIGQQEILMEQFPGAAALVSRGGSILGENEKFKSGFGITEAQQVPPSFMLARWAILSAGGESVREAPVFRINDKDVRFQARWVGERQALMVAVEDVSTLVKSGRLCREVLEKFPNAVLVRSEAEDGQPKIAFVNEEIEKIFGYTTNEWIERPELHREIINPKDRKRVREDVLKAQKEERKVTVEYRATRKDGKRIWTRHIVNFFRGSDGELYSAESIRDISQEMKLYKKLERQSRTDSLTGLSNRRELIRCLAEAWEYAKRTKTPLSILFIDNDNFKKFNDTFGQEIGDKRLKAIAKLIKDNIRRRIDKIGRLGGEEFVVILPATNEQVAMILAEKIRKAAEVAIGTADPKFILSVAGESFTPGFTVSIGVITLKVGDTRIASPEELLRMANKAERRAKDEGKNRVCVIGKG